MVYNRPEPTTKRIVGANSQMNRKSVPYWRRSVTKSTASKNSSSNVNMKAHPGTGTERIDLDVVWKLSRSARYSGLFVVNVLNVWRAILNLIREATGSQCSKITRRYKFVVILSNSLDGGTINENSVSSVITRTLTLEPHTACRKGAGGWNIK